MEKEFLESFAREQKGREIEFGDFSYELEKMGFEDIFDDLNNEAVKELLESGVVYYTFVKNVGMNEENEDLDGLKLKVEFDVKIWNGEDEVADASLIKITDCDLEEF